MMSPDNMPPPPVRGSRQVEPPRRIPPPRPILIRTLFLLIDPEAWSRAAMYPFRITFGPLVLVSLIMSSIIWINGCRKMYTAITQFSRSYDSHYDPMVLTGNHLKLIPTAGKKPLHYITPRFKLIYSTKSTPPTLSKYTLMAIKLTPGGYYLAGNPFISSPKLQPYRTLHQMFARSLALPLKAGKLPAVLINANTLQGVTRNFFFFLVVIGGMVLTVLGTISMLLWAAVAMVFAAPVVALVNLELRMPLRVAYRIACAVAVPMIVLRGILLIYNVLPSVPQTFAQQMIPFLVPVGVSIWAALLARKMYGRPKPPPKR